MTKEFLKKRLCIRDRILAKSIWYALKRKRILNLNIKNNQLPSSEKLHLGCGNRHVKDWLNTDLIGSEYNTDFIRRKLPWKSESFRVIVSQHVVEHLYIEDELIPLFMEMRRVLKPEGEIWISTPDIEKIFKSYMTDKGKYLVSDRKKRIPNWTLGDFPDQQIINDLFYQNGEHVNLFDFELLKWTLEKAGFITILLSNEEELLKYFPEFPSRNDGFQTLYVKAVK